MRPFPHLFQRATTPKNSLELLQWLIFEPVILKKFSEQLSKKQVVTWFLRTYFRIAFGATLVYLTASFIVVLLDFPAHFPSIYTSEFLITWRDIQSFERYRFLLVTALSFLVGSLAWGLALGLAWGLTGSLTGSLVWGLAGSLAWGFALGLSGVLGLAWGLAGGSAWGSAWGLALGSALGLISAWGVIRGLVVGLLWGLAWAWTWGLAGGWTGEVVEHLLLSLTGSLTFALAFITSFYFTCFRLPFYPYHLLKIFFPIDFYHNPYLHDGVIWLPLPTVRKRLTQLAFQQPDIALEFVGFLLEYRPLQRKLAMHTLHAATAGEWAHFPLEANSLRLPNIAKDMKQFMPSKDWRQQFAHLKHQLVKSQMQSGMNSRKTEFERFLTALKKFRSLTLRERSLWRDHYLNALDHWLTVAQEKLKELITEANTREPISRNLYRPGEVLNSNSANIFFGREDLCNELARRILTSSSMPLFLIQGQQGVGKTSLLNFLEKLLGSQFKVVVQDCQNEQIHGVVPWLQEVQRRLQEHLNLPLTPWQTPLEGLAAWGKFKEYLETLSYNKHYKLLLAFDHYEKLHRFFQRNRTEAEDLLAAMRSFSQRQNRVVFLFVGTHWFSELQYPHWNKYFVQVEHFRVDYLKKSEALRLITEPVSLVYPPEIPERMFELTQGHPALLQKLCREIVNIANTDLRKQITAQDLEKAIHTTLDYENLAMIVFWTKFCEDPACKMTVKQILNHQEPTDPYHRSRLAEYGYIVQEKGVWKLRVPLFIRWLEQHVEAFQ